MENRNVRDILQGLHGKYVRQLAVKSSIPGLLAGAVLALIWSLITRATGMVGFPSSAVFKILLVVLGGVASTLYIMRTAIPSVYGLAKRLDDRLGMSDRLSTAYALQAHLPDDPMVRIVVAETHERLEQADLRKGLPSPNFAALAGGVVLFLISMGLTPDPVAVVDQPEIEEDTRVELTRQIKKLDGLMELKLEDLSDEDLEHYQRIREMIDALQLQDKRLSRKEMLARFSREIEGLEDLGERSEALKSMLEQLKEAKDAVASRMLVNRQIEEIEAQHTELAVKDAKTGETLKAEEIEVMVVQEKRRRQQEAMAEEMKKVAEDEAKGEDVTQWVVAETEEGATEEGGGAGKPTRKERVIISYEDLVKAAEKKDIRQMIFSAAGDQSRETQEYREVYSNYERAFKNLLLQGSLSLGTRQYLRRYFKSIRPLVPKETKDEPKEEGAPKADEEGA